jgi:D-alanyl-D-alanine dipeptidase
MHPLILKLQNNPDFVNVGEFPGVITDLRYGSTNNFMGKNIYHDFNQAFLHKIAAEKFQVALQKLTRVKPGYKMLLFDCLRPASAHQHLWNFVAETPQEIYVANPEKGSLHSFGFAVDLSLVDEHGNEADMGTEFDSFHDLAQPRYEEDMLRKGLLSQRQHENRLLLREVMVSAGFRQLSFEWWHYDAEEAGYVRENFSIIH